MFSVLYSQVFAFTKNRLQKKLIIDNQNRFWRKEYNPGTLIGTEFQPEDT